MADNDCRFALARRLAQFLRKNGDKVILGSCKLSLTTSALCLLNSLFLDVLNQDSFSTTDSCVSEILEDVQFLYDFIKKTSSLKLFHGMQTLRGGVDLSHFSNLTVLELRKIPAHLIIGLNSFSVQLKALICTRSIYLLKEIFGCPDEREITTDIWIELKELNLSYNYLDTLDNSFKSLPSIEILDLSHNNIKNTDEIKILKQLKLVNLSYNQLDKLPVFSSLSCRCLLKLYIRYNNLEDLNGLECLFALEELDVGYNLLSDYYVLNPLDKLKSLKMLNLEGNPLFFHNQHRMLVASYLHPNVLSRGFHLNGKFLLMQGNNFPIEGALNGLNNARSHQTAINTVVGDMQNMIHAPVTSNISENVSIHPVLLDTDNCGRSSVSSNVLNEDIKTSQRKSEVSKTRVKLREVPINNPVEVYDDELSLSPKNDGADVPSYLRAKLVMEARRKDRGESWLIPDNSFQRLVISPPKVPSNTPVFSNPNVQTLSTKNFSSDLQDRLESHNINAENISKSPPPSPCAEEMTEVLDLDRKTNSVDRERHISKESDIEILTDMKDDTEDVPTTSKSDDNCIWDVYKNNTEHVSDDECEGVIDEESDEESEDSIFFVERKSNSRKENLFVNIGAKYAKEKDVISGKVRDTLDLGSLSSVYTTIKEEGDQKICEVHLEFDTTKSSRQKRVYMFDDPKLAKKMSQILQPFADAKVLKEATLGALECLKCNSQFSKQVARLKILKTQKPLLGKEILSSSYDSSKGDLLEIEACPNCGSNILVEMEQIPLPSIANPPHISLKTNLFAQKKSSENTPETVSTGSPSSGNLFANLFSSIKISPALKRKFSSADNPNEDGSSPKLNNPYITCEVENAKSHGMDSQLSRNSSDITIISNPSQSSIAIIPDPELESNLQPIIERDSLSSLSPPVSRNSTLCFSDKVEEYQNLHIDAGFQNDLTANGIHPISDIEDPDFCSATESFVDENDKQVKNTDIASSGSEMYFSPHKSAGSGTKKHDSPMLDESTKLLNMLGEKEIVTYDSFKELHHRLKLHIEINLFGEDEHLLACLETSVVPLSTGIEMYGLFVLSSKKVYVIKFLPMYSENLEDANIPVEKIIQTMYSGPLNQLKQVKYILGNQGLTVACGPSSQVYTLVIRDSDVCNLFISLLSDLIQENVDEFGKIEFLSSSDQTLSLLKETVLSSVDSDPKPEILLHVFAFLNSQIEENCPICIALTQDGIFLSKILYTKQDSCLDLRTTSIYQYSSIDHQKISDIISLKLQKKILVVEISFLNESFSEENENTSSWTIKMATLSSLLSLINALKSPWEEIFGVSLPLTLF